MTQTIEQLRWLGNYLAADAESKGIGQGSEGARYCWSAASEIEQLRARIAELEAAQTELEAAHAAAVLSNVQLRDALKTFSRHKSYCAIHLTEKQNPMGGICNCGYEQVIATPISTEALDKYLAEKVKEYQKHNGILGREVKDLTRQRDLAVEALERIARYGGWWAQDVAGKTIATIRESENENKLE